MVPRVSSAAASSSFVATTLCFLLVLNCCSTMRGVHGDEEAVDDSPPVPPRARTTAAPKTPAPTLGNTGATSPPPSFSPPEPESPPATILSDASTVRIMPLGDSLTTCCHHCAVQANLLPPNKAKRLAEPARPYSGYIRLLWHLLNGSNPSPVALNTSAVPIEYEALPDFVRMSETQPEVALRQKQLQMQRKAAGAGGFSLAGADDALRPKFPLQFQYVGSVKSCMSNGTAGKKYPMRVPSDWDVAYEGHYGFTATRLAKKVPIAMELAKPDVVLFGIGTNDLITPHPGMGHAWAAIKGSLKRILSRGSKIPFEGLNASTPEECQVPTKVSDLGVAGRRSEASKSWWSKVVKGGSPPPTLSPQLQHMQQAFLVPHVFVSLVPPINYGTLGGTKAGAKLKGKQSRVWKMNQHLKLLENAKFFSVTSDENEGQPQLQQEKGGGGSSQPHILCQDSIIKGVPNYWIKSRVHLVDQNADMKLNTDYHGDGLHPNINGEWKMALRHYRALMSKFGGLPMLGEDAGGGGGTGGKHGGGDAAAADDVVDEEEDENGVLHKKTRRAAKGKADQKNPHQKNLNTNNAADGAKKAATPGGATTLHADPDVNVTSMATLPMMVILMSLLVLLNYVLKKFGCRRLVAKCLRAVADAVDHAPTHNNHPRK